MHALDLLGVGNSSAGNFSQSFSADEAKNYLIDSIEKWRKEVGISSFALAGHSFGSYIATLYFEKYAEIVEKLIHLSPSGSSENVGDLLKEEIEKKSDRGLKGRFCFYLFKNEVILWVLLSFIFCYCYIFKSHQTLSL